MKKTFTAMIILVTALSLNAQCLTSNNGEYPNYIFTPNCDGLQNKIVEYAYTSEYSKINVTKGTEYEFINKNYNGGTYGYITISDGEGKTVLAHGAGKLKWTAEKDGVIRYYSHMNGTDCEKEDWDASFDRTLVCNKAAVEYCKPILDCSNGAVITTVSLADYSNTTECSTNGYADYTTKKITLKKETDYDLSVSVGYGWHEQSVSMWIDTNKNLMFDQNEFIYVGQQNNGAGTVTKTINIPSTVPDGEYQMRIRLATTPQANAAWSKSCDGADAYGETEDYTVNIVTNLDTKDIKESEIKISQNPVVDVLHISDVSNVTEISIINSNGQIIKKLTPHTNIDLKFLTSGIYILNIKQKDGKKISKKIIKK